MIKFKLKLKDINTKRNMIHMKTAKGRKDSYLEDVTDLQCIQELLDHKGLKITEIYTHIIQLDIERIRRL